MTYYLIDAFTQRPFGGNPAAVVPLETWLPAELMQQIAAENNQSETAFFVQRPGTNGGHYDLRWFTPAYEIDLCGHATLASAQVLYQFMDYAADAVVFHSRSGPLPVRRELDGRLTLDFPSRPAQPLPAPPPGLALAPGRAAPPCLAARDLVVVLDSEAEVLAFQPSQAAGLAAPNTPYLGLIITAPGIGDVDFVSRFFDLGLGLLEDPVTGSAHCNLIPYWAARLGKTELLARQLSRRGGELWCALRADGRVHIGGYARAYATGRLLI